jgi:hypothetical protein
MRGSFSIPLRVDDLAEPGERFTIIVRPQRGDPILEAPVRFDIGVTDTVAAG